MDAEIKKSATVIEVKENNKIEWLYLEINDEATRNWLEIDLYHVRAADSIRIMYDGRRDGWAILQASVFYGDPGKTNRDESWKEVAFIKAWAT